MVEEEEDAGVECAMYMFEAVDIALVSRVVARDGMAARFPDFFFVSEREVERKKTYLTKTAPFNIQLRSSGGIARTRLSTSRSSSNAPPPPPPSGSSTTTRSSSWPFSPSDGSSCTLTERSSAPMISPLSSFTSTNRRRRSSSSSSPSPALAPAATTDGCDT